MAGCYAVESLLQSTLECLFDQVCVDNLLQFFAKTNTSDIDILLINQTRFHPKTLIETLVNELFIEQWLTTSSFSAYYNQCFPIACTYTFVQRNSIAYGLTTLIGLYGGLTVILRFCVPHVIQWWRNRTNRPLRNHTRTFSYSVKHNKMISYLLGVPLIQRFQAAYRRMKIIITQLNLYKIDRRNTDPYNLTTAIISTRIYLLVLGLSITNLIIFTSLQIDIQSITVENPSRKTFEDLHNKYSTTLQCPCSQIAINYGSFVSLSPKYHPVCSSPYVSTAWILSIIGQINPQFIYTHYDFHMVGQAFFSTVSILCSTAQSTLSGAWLIFNHSTLIIDHALPYKELISRTNSTLDQFESNTINEFKRLFSLIRLHAKTMLSTKRSNIDLYTRQLINDNIEV
jgi:hypothetical protein